MLNITMMVMTIILTRVTAEVLNIWGQERELVFSTRGILEAPRFLCQTNWALQMPLSMPIRSGLRQSSFYLNLRLNFQVNSRLHLIRTLSQSVPEPFAEKQSGYH